MGLERRGRVILACSTGQPRSRGMSRMSEPKPDGKPFVISKRLVWEAWRRVKANRGAAGVDEESIQAFEANLKANLYKVWNRMSSGSYMPPPVRAVEIPKKAGGSRMLGVPTVADRVAQTVAYLYLEPEVEPVFHPDSYGYRPGRSAHDALGTCRQRCWRYDWVLDLDLKSFFDSLDHSLVLKAVAHHTNLRWILLYVERWLKAPLQLEDGTLRQRDRGSPQGSAISPVLANIFLHYALDMWLGREFPDVPFERYADDVILHCKSKQQAQIVLDAIIERLAQVGLELNLDKTRIVYCKDSNRTGSHEHEQFDVPRLHVSSAAGAEQGWREVRQLPPGGLGRCREGDPPHDQALAAALAQRADPRRPRTGDQPDRAGLDQLLRPLLPDRADPDSQAHQRLLDALGHAEIQTAARPSRAREPVPGGDRQAGAGPVRPLGVGSAANGWMTRAR